MLSRLLRLTMPQLFFPALLLLVSMQGVEANLSDRACGTVEAILASADGLEISGRCEAEAADRVLLVSVTTTDATHPRGPLQLFTLGFCGEIVNATAPAGWSVTVDPQNAASGQPAKVHWKLVEPQGATNAAEPTRTDGFSVVMKPGWRRAIAFEFQWRSSSGFSGSPHDCGEWPR
jgi:hypothetical protein